MALHMQDVKTSRCLLELLQEQHDKVPWAAGNSLIEGKSHTEQEDEQQCRYPGTQPDPQGLVMSANHLLPPETQRINSIIINTSD